jgi:uncharacterized protein with von Willebrand factor type A (vWA) domain
MSRKMLSIVLNSITLNIFKLTLNKTSRSSRKFMYFDEKIMFRKRILESNNSLEFKLVKTEKILKTRNSPKSKIIRRLNAVLSKSLDESFFEVSLKTIGPKPISINFDTSTVKATIEENSPYCSTPRFLAISVTETRVMSISAPLPKKIDVTLPETLAAGCIG